jgi:hypothetical protein
LTLTATRTRVAGSLVAKTAAECRLSARLATVCQTPPGSSRCSCTVRPRRPRTAKTCVQMLPFASWRTSIRGSTPTVIRRLETEPQLAE